MSWRRRSPRLESQVSEKDAELAATKASAGGGKDAGALKENLLKKDKEILKLKQELNEKETELVDLREKEAGFEEQASSSAGEIAKRDAQVKALTQKVEQLTGDKKKGDAAVNAAKDEARSAAAQLDAANEQLADLQGRTRFAQRTSEELERAASEARTGRAARSRPSRLELDVRAQRARVAQERPRLDEEPSTTSAWSRARGGGHAGCAPAGELEESNSKNEDRVVKAYQKIKGDEKLREKTRKAISVALQLLDDSAGANVIDDKDLNA